MSLADQSLQFFPVSARVSVLRARGLRIKGKDGTNDAYTALQAGRETFRTPVAEKRAEPVWGGDDAAFIFTLPAESARAEQDGVPLQVRVLHRVPLGADKLLGLTVINVHELRQNSARENPQWFKLLNKAGKADKERGEILLDIQFLKSSMSVSMIDLSDKSHSRVGKFKDKLRGKKKDGLSDSASAILPSVSQVLTDSEGEMDGETEGESPKKKKNKLKSLFVPKSNMKRNSMSQSMSSLGTLPDKNSSISSSTSSGLNVESSEGKKKKKFTFLTHKRNGSTDSKASNHSDFTLGSANQNPPSQIDICINGSHVYREATQSEEVQEMEEEEEGEKEEEEQEQLEEERRREAEEERMKKEKEEQRRKEEEEKERIRREKEEHRRRIEEEEEERIRVEREKEEQRRKVAEEKEKIRMEREKEEQKRRLEEEEKERIRIEREKEEQKRRMEEEEKERRRIEIEKEEQRRRIEEEEKERIRIEREKEEQKRRMVEEEKERIRMEREKEEQKRRMVEEENERIRVEREKEEQKRRMEEEEKERIRMEREKEEQKRRMVEEENERIRVEREKEEQKRRMEEEEKERRIEIEKEEQRRRIKEKERERQSIEKEEQRRKLEEEERIRMKREKEEQMRKLEEERKRKEEREAEELRRKIEEENDRKKAEEDEKMRIAEQERMKEEKKRAEKKRMMEEEEKHKEEKRIEMERRLADEKKAREEEERRIAEEKEKQRKEEERVTEEKEWKKAELEIKRKEEEQKRRNMEIDEKKKKEKQMREEQEGLRKEENLFGESVISQSTDFTRSARISNVKPSVSVSATVSQPSMANTNPFLDDDLDGSISENVISVEETTAKKGRAPLPPHKKPQLTESDVSSRGVPKQHCHLKDISKRPAPQPPGMMTREVTVKEKMDQAVLCQGARKTPERHHVSKVSSVSQEDTQVDTNPFTCDGPVAVNHRRPAPKPGSGISVSEDKPRNYGKNLTEGTVHLEEKASASNSKGNPPNCKLLSAQNDITAEDAISDLTDDLSQREKHLEDIVEPDSAKPNVPSCVNQDLCPEPLISNTDGLPSMERSKKKSQAPLPPSKPKRTGDPSTPHQQLSLPNKPNLEQAQESHSNKKYQDNALASSVEILAISTPSSSTVSSSTFTPLAEKSQVMKPCATESLETDSGSGSSTLPWAKVVPSDAGEVREQVAPTSVIRQHAVKPLSAAENLPETHESRVTDNTQPKTKAASAVMKGPYSQLTQTELISLALRQQEQISQRDARIQELEQYIDNLLVRVMEEKPSILMTMDTKNKSM